MSFEDDLRNVELLVDFAEQLLDEYVARMAAGAPDVPGVAELDPGEGHGGG